VSIFDKFLVKVVDYYDAGINRGICKCKAELQIKLDEIRKLMRDCNKCHNKKDKTAINCIRVDCNNVIIDKILTILEAK